MSFDENPENAWLFLNTGFLLGRREPLHYASTSSTKTALEGKTHRAGSSQLRPSRRGRVTDSQHVDHGLLDTVHTDHLVHRVVHERADATRTEAHLRRRDVRVLAEMPRLEQAIAIAPVL